MRSSTFGTQRSSDLSILHYPDLDILLSCHLNIRRSSDLGILGASN